METAFLIASIASTAIGAATSAIGQARQASAQRQQAQYQARVAENNAITANRLAQDATQRGQIEEQRSRAETKRLQGRQVAALAASGVDVQSGSALDIISDTAALGEIDALTIRDNAAREAWQHRAQAQNFTQQGTLFSAEAANTSSLAPVGTLLTGIGGIADQWWQYRRHTANTGGVG